MPPRRRSRREREVDRGTPVWAYCALVVFVLGLLGIIIPAAILFAREGTVGSPPLPPTPTPVPTPVPVPTVPVPIVPCNQTQPCFFDLRIDRPTCAEMEPRACTAYGGTTAGTQPGDSCMGATLDFRQQDCPVTGCLPARGACIAQFGVTNAVGCAEIDALDCAGPLAVFMGYGTKCNSTFLRDVVGESANVTFGCCILDSFDGTAAITTENVCPDTFLPNQDCPAERHRVSVSACSQLGFSCNHMAPRACSMLMGAPVAYMGSSCRANFPSHKLFPRCPGDRPCVEDVRITGSPDTRCIDSTLPCQTESPPPTLAFPFMAEPDNDVCCSIGSGHCLMINETACTTGFGGTALGAACPICAGPGCTCANITYPSLIYPRSQAIQPLLVADFNMTNITYYGRQACCLPDALGCTETDPNTCESVWGGTPSGSYGTRCENSTCSCAGDPMAVPYERPNEFPPLANTTTNCTATRPCFRQNKGILPICFEATDNACVLVGGVSKGLPGDTCLNASYDFTDGDCPVDGCLPPRGACYSAAAKGCLEVDYETCELASASTFFAGYNTLCTAPYMLPFEGVGNRICCVNASISSYPFYTTQSTCANLGGINGGIRCPAILETGVVACSILPGSACIHTSTQACAANSGTVVSNTQSCVNASAVSSQMKAKFDLVANEPASPIQPCIERFSPGVTSGPKRCVEVPSVPETQNALGLFKVPCCMFGFGCVEVDQAMCTGVFGGTIGGPPGSTCDTSNCVCNPPPP